MAVRATGNSPLRRARRLLAKGIALLAVASAGVQAASQAPVGAEHGMVVTAHQLATRVGVEVLKAGGNAIDAAVAVGYTLAVVYPAAGNLGGGGFMTIGLADGRKTFLDFRETAPRAATADLYLDASGRVIPGASTRGHRAVAVPGTVSGLETALASHGTMPRAALMAAAIRLAHEGFVLEPGDIEMLSTATEAFRDDPATAAIFLNRGRPFEIGDRLVQKDLARTLRLIRRHGSDGFYRGRVASALVASSQSQAGLLTHADLAGYRTRERQPVGCSYRGYGVVSAPPPSAGGVAICQILAILEGYPMPALGFRSAQAVHYQIEAMRHAFVDRNHRLGDPDFVRNPIDRLLDPAYAAQLRAAIEPQRAGDSQALQPGVPPHEGSNTTHYSIVDRWGNAVSTTVTLNDWFGAKVTAATTGVLLNNEMDDFTAQVGTPNLYGLVQGEANRIEPGKRPLSSMAPTLLTRDGQTVAVLGTPGGSRIITTLVHVITNLIDHGMTLQEAIDAPRFHQQWLPDVTRLEPYALSPDTKQILEGWGHRFGAPQPANHVAAILLGAPTLGGRPVGRNRYYGANDPRRNTGLALGY